jgi:hypothetical protein
MYLCCSDLDSFGNGLFKRSYMSVKLNSLSEGRASTGTELAM